MFSLIVTIIAVLLVMLIAGAVLWYGGSALSGQGDKAAAQTLINQGHQIIGAAYLYANDNASTWAASPSDLVNYYLAELPMPQKAAYKVGLTPSPSDWQWLNGTHHLILPEINQKVCQAVDTIVGLSSIPTDIDPDHIIQCYGTSEPYTFFYDPPGASKSERINLGGTLIPPGPGTISIVCGNGSCTVFTTPPGQSSSSNSTPVAGPFPNMGAPTSPMPVIVPNAPFITPPGWTSSNSNAPAEPTPPSTLTVTNVWQSCHTNNYCTYAADPQTSCNSAWSTYPGAVGQYYGHWYTTGPNNSTCSGYRVSDNGLMGQIGDWPYTQCPSGYSGSGQAYVTITNPPQTSTGTCTLANVAATIKPADSKCEMAISSGNLAPDSRDADCANVSTSQPGTGSNAGTAAWGNKTLLMAGNYGLGLTLNSDGSVKAKQCTYSTALGYTGCF